MNFKRFKPPQACACGGFVVKRIKTCADGKNRVMDKITAADGILEYFRKTHTQTELNIAGFRVRIIFSEDSDAPVLEDALVKIAVGQTGL